MGTLGVHQNISASDIKVTPSLGRDYIGPPLVMDKLIPVKSRGITSPPTMSSRLEVKRTPAVITKLRFILVTHTDHLKAPIENLLTMQQIIINQLLSFFLRFLQ